MRNWRHEEKEIPVCDCSAPEAFVPDRAIVRVPQNLQRKVEPVID
jgi:hypothetical protein